MVVGLYNFNFQISGFEKFKVEKSEE